MNIFDSYRLTVPSVLNTVNVVGIEYGIGENVSIFVLFGYIVTATPVVLLAMSTK